MATPCAFLESDVDDARADAESAERRRIVMERLLKDTLTEERIRAESTQRELRDKNDELERIKQVSVVHLC